MFMNFYVDRICLFWYQINELYKPDSFDIVLISIRLLELAWCKLSIMASKMGLQYFHYHTPKTCCNFPLHGIIHINVLNDSYFGHKCCQQRVMVVINIVYFQQLRVGFGSDNLIFACLDNPTKRTRVTFSHLSKKKRTFPRALLDIFSLN